MGDDWIERKRKEQEQQQQAAANAQLSREQSRAIFVRDADALFAEIVESFRRNAARYNAQAGKTGEMTVNPVGGNGVRVRITTFPGGVVELTLDKNDAALKLATEWQLSIYQEEILVTEGELRFDIVDDRLVLAGTTPDDLPEALLSPLIDWIFENRRG